jgi:hypothetical protein
MILTHSTQRRTHAAGAVALDLRQESASHAALGALLAAVGNLETAGPYFADVLDTVMAARLDLARRVALLQDAA